MQLLAIIADIVSSLDINVEIGIFLSALLLYCVLQVARKSHFEKKLGRKGYSCTPSQQQTKPEVHSDMSTFGNQSGAPDSEKLSFAQIDKSLHDAFDTEDYGKVLKCWYALKKFRHCHSVNLSQIVKAMQCCDKSAYFIVAELKDFFKTHPRNRDIAIVNDIIEPLCRGLDDRVGSQLVEGIVNMLPSVYLSKDSRTYEILLTMHVAKENMTKAQDIIAEMQSSGVAFTPRATLAVMSVALHLGKIEVALKAFCKLKDSWDVRSTWAVSPFALQRHKTNMLTRVVKLACKEHKVRELLPMLKGMEVPAEVMKLLHTECVDKRHRAFSDASTSEGTKSDSEVDD